MKYLSIALLFVIVGKLELHAQGSGLTPEILIGDWTSYYVMDSAKYLKASDSAREELNLFKWESCYSPYPDAYTFYHDHTFDCTPDQGNLLERFHTGEWKISGDTLIEHDVNNRAYTYYTVRVISRNVMEWKRVKHVYMTETSWFRGTYFYVVRVDTTMHISRDILSGKWTQYRITDIPQYLAISDSMKNEHTIDPAVSPLTMTYEFTKDWTYRLYDNSMVDGVIKGHWICIDDSIVFDFENPGERGSAFIRVIAPDKLEMRRRVTDEKSGENSVQYYFLERIQ